MARRHTVSHVMDTAAQVASPALRLHAARTAVWYISEGYYVSNTPRHAPNAHNPPNTLVISSLQALASLYAVELTDCALSEVDPPSCLFAYTCEQWLRLSNDRRRQLAIPWPQVDIDRPGVLRIVRNLYDCHAMAAGKLLTALPGRWTW